MEIHNAERQQLPNATLILVFGILSIVGCCCWGIVGLIFGIVALILSTKATEIYNANPEMYTGFQNVKTGRILAIIGIILSSLVLIANIAMLVIYGVEGIEQMQREMIEQYGG
ncbi:MAG TPA: CCC motif membrane protein [Gillisia sp.]|nr:CCC motif membrane protein [Gillisia sp.]